MKCMVFVDGSNFLTQLGRNVDVEVRPEKPKDACVTVACEIVNWITSRQLSNWRVIRRFWFGSYLGNDVDEDRLRRTLRASHFEPVIFKRHDNKEKGVDIALTKEVLVNAFADNYDLCYLVAGDEDYVVLVNEVKRYGPAIWGLSSVRGFQTGSGSLLMNLSYWIRAIRHLQDFLISSAQPPSVLQFDPPCMLVSRKEFYTKCVGDAPLLQLHLRDHIFTLNCHLLEGASYPL